MIRQEGKKAIASQDNAKTKTKIKTGDKHKRPKARSGILQKNSAVREQWDKSHFDGGLVGLGLG